MTFNEYKIKIFSGLPSVQTAIKEEDKLKVIDKCIKRMDQNPMLEEHKFNELVKSGDDVEGIAHAVSKIMPILCLFKGLED